MRSRWTLLAAALPVGILATTACSDTTSTSTTATYVTAELGNAQTATVQTALPDSLEVLVADASNNAVSGVTVTWTASAFGGLASTSSIVTNSSGIAKIAWTLGAKAGPDSMTASIATTAGTVAAFFTATATAGPAAAVTPFSATTQANTAGSIVPLIVQVVDQYDNLVSGATVTWTVTQGAGSLNGTSSTTIATTTDTSGQAGVNWTLGAGSSTVTATITIVGGTTQSVTFTGTGS